MDGDLAAGVVDDGLALVAASRLATSGVAAAGLARLTTLAAVVDLASTAATGAFFLAVVLLAFDPRPLVALRVETLVATGVRNLPKLGAAGLAATGLLVGAGRASSALRRTRYTCTA